MQISGINKFTMIDFPGKIACVIFTAGCNFRCPFCHNPEFVLPELLKENIKNLISEKAFFTFLESRKGMLEGVSICGGEPTLQKDLVEFCKKIKDMGFLIKLDTNGRDPKALKQLIEKNLVDYIAMDIKNPPGKMSEIVGLQLDESLYLESINILLSSQIDYEFRTTVISGIHSLNDIEDISKHIKGAKNYFIQNFKKQKILNQSFNGESFSDEKLKSFKEIALKYIDKVDIRN